MNKINSKIQQEENKVEEFSRKKAYTVISIFLVSLLIIIFILSRYFNFGSMMSSLSTKDPASASDLIDLESYTDMKNSDLDNDGDGVPNWQEVALGTDPENPNNFSELDLANNEELEKINYLSNFTQLISRDLYVTEQYSNQDSNIDTDSINSELLVKLSSILKAPRTEVLTIIDNPTSSDYKNYYSDMGLLFSYMSSSQGKELKEIKTTLDTEKEDFTFTKDFMNKLNSMCEEYKTIKVPLNLSNLHKDVLQDCENYVLTMYGFMEYEKDPVKTQVAINNYSSVYNQMYSDFKLYSEKVKAQGYNKNDLKYGNIYYLTN